LHLKIRTNKELSSGSFLHMCVCVCVCVHMTNWNVWKLEKRKKLVRFIGIYVTCSQPGVTYAPPSLYFAL
jgi:hypothetical protein